MYKYAGIIIDSKYEKLDKIFIYKIPKELINAIDYGYMVKVPFGRGNKLINGFVFQLYDEKPQNITNVKEIKKLCYNYRVLTQNDIMLIKGMKNKYLCTYIDCIRTILPNGIMKCLHNKFIKFISIGEKPKGKFNKEPYISIYNFVMNNNGKYRKSQISKKVPASISSINTMIKHGYLNESEVLVNRYNDRQYEEYKEKILNNFQQYALEKIINTEKSISLIHGITGSGKTEIYMHLVSYMLKENKDCIILVPEIALTPQMVERFKGRFGKNITVFHSKLSDGEKFDEWLRVRKGEVKVAIGARSAIFLPFNNLGLIVIDEEHESTYKSDITPKYDTREIAYMKSQIQGCKVVLGSATPSIETYYKALNKEIELITINKRADGANLPDIKVIDMRQELLNNNRSIFSKELYSLMKESLSKKEQIILFINRRGYSTFVSCRQCGYVFKCDNCDISLTYHLKNNYLCCHYCGKKIKAPKICPKCGSKYVKYFGIGTEKIEKEIKKYFPSANVLRMDFDTTRSKDSYEIIYNKFKNEEADILIGTQMLAKGLDFKNVTLVGIIAADLSLNLPDYRACERTFQLITQVSGRAGRGKKTGKVIVQTYNPENYSIKFAANNNYSGFYNKEIKLRYSMMYPPYCDIFSIKMSSLYEDLLIKNIQNVGIHLKHFFKNSDNINILGPCPCVISKIKNNYRWQIILKGDIDINLARKVKDIIYECIKNDFNVIKVNLDINPNNIL